MFLYFLKKKIQLNLKTKVQYNLKIILYLAIVFFRNPWNCPISEPQKGSPLWDTHIGRRGGPRVFEPTSRRPTRSLASGQSFASPSLPYPLSFSLSFSFTSRSLEPLCFYLLLPLFTKHSFPLQVRRATFLNKSNFLRLWHIHAGPVTTNCN